ncbi:MAG: FGGY-family carbohydrate kinase [Acidobacteriota bacterium]
MEVVLGIDLGTSYFKLALVDRAGTLRGLGRVFVPKDEGDGTRCELPVERFWNLLREGLSQACREGGVQPSDICAVAYSSQANSFLLLDASDEPLTPLVLWPDHRDTPVAPSIRELFQRDDFLLTTGLGIDAGPGLCVSKLAWFRKHQPNIWSRTRRVMTISDYLSFALTGRTVGDMGTAALMAVLDLKGHRWWEEALGALKLSRSLLSDVLVPGTVAGVVQGDVAQSMGLRPGIPFAVGSLDHHVASTGVGHIAQMSESTGTVLACLHSTREYRPRPDCCLGPGFGSGEYYELAFNDNGAVGMEWYQRRFAPDHSLPELDSLAESVAPGCDGLIALPEAFKEDGLGGFRHVTVRHGHGHFIRALMESTAFSLSRLVGHLRGDDLPARIAATGGGARSSVWLQIKADVLGVEVVTALCREPACLGAGMLAAMAAGWFQSLADAGRSWIAIEQRFTPDAARSRAYAEWAQQYRQEL